MKKKLSQVPENQIKKISKKRHYANLVLSKKFTSEDKNLRKSKMQSIKTPIPKQPRHFVVEYEEYSSKTVKKLAIRIKASIIKIAYTIYK
jgi:hypothetical protein